MLAESFRGPESSRSSKEIQRRVTWRRVETLGLGVGTLVLTVNAILLGGYTLGCHSLRHLVGGGLDVLFDKPVRRTAHACVGCLNKRHMLFAWMSLFWVAFTDVYVRLLSMGIWADWRLF